MHLVDLSLKEEEMALRLVDSVMNPPTRHLEAQSPPLSLQVREAENKKHFLRRAFLE